MKDLYTAPFAEAKPYLRTIYLDPSFVSDLNIDIKSFEFAAVYTATSLAPIILVNGIKINDYLTMHSTEDSMKQFKKEGKLFTPPNPDLLFLGYKHFDKWKFPNGEQIGDLQGSVVNSIKLKKMVQKKVLGATKYYALRVLRKI